MLLKTKLIAVAVTTLLITSTAAAFVTKQWLDTRDELNEAKMALEQAVSHSERLSDERDRLTATITQMALERDTERSRLRQLQQELAQAKTEAAKVWKEEAIPDEILSILNR